MFLSHPRAPAGSVIVHSLLGRPRAILFEGDRLDVTAVEAMRDESAAYPLGSGPRHVFVVQAAGRRFRVVHLLRDGRWTVERLAKASEGLASAA